MKALVEFVGAGPGAEDLITVRGLRALEQADLVVYAGSLVNPAHLKACKADCTCLDSASMNLGEQIEAMSDAALAGKRVVRLHTGDPAMYGAINEQIRGLAQKGVAASIIPGVSSVFAAAAALGCELTSPDVSQSVVLTRTPGRTPMPQGEDAAAFARTGAMLVFFLSTGKVGELMRHLMEQGGLAEDTPAAIVYRASWPDERILRGTVGDIARQAEEAGLGRQALVIVGRALGANGTASRLYDADFSHGYRNRLVSENFDGRCALYAFTDKGLTRAREPRFGDIPIRVLPGITAATIAAASLGAPLQNGFSLVSLSDLLVPADEVRRNIRSVAQSLLPVALYNPAGRKRRALLDETLAVFREHRGRDVLCAYVKNAGREQETKWAGKLSEFPAAEVDMSTLIIIGGPRTRLDSGVLYEPRGYVEKYME